MDFGKFLGTGFARTYIEAHPSCSDSLKITLIVSAVFLCCIIGYLIGSVNFAIILSRARHSDDVRNYGSNNAGATNMLRTYGKKAAIATFFGDFGKALLACFIGYVCFGNDGAYLAGLFCVIGHVFPLFFKFKGGKGVSTTAGVMLACDPGTFAIIFIIYFIVLFGTQYVSLASIMSAFLYPLILRGMQKIIQTRFFFNDLYLTFAIAMSVVVIIKHIPNMKRIVNKTESKLNLKKFFSKKKADKSDETSADEKALPNTNNKKEK